MENYIVEFVDDSKNVIQKNEWYGYRKIIMTWINKMLNFYEKENNKILSPVIKKLTDKK